MLVCLTDQLETHLKDFVGDQNYGKQHPLILPGYKDIKTPLFDNKESEWFK